MGVLLASQSQARTLFLTQESTEAPAVHNGELKCQGYSAGIEQNPVFQELTTSSNDLPVDIANMTFYRDDWYTYCYNYYDGQFYDYYDEFYGRQVNRTIEQAVAKFNLTAESTGLLT